jgi:hypothetical protein
MVPLLFVFITIQPFGIMSITVLLNKFLNLLKLWLKLMYTFMCFFTVAS